MQPHKFPILRLFTRILATAAVATAPACTDDDHTDASTFATPGGATSPASDDTGDDAGASCNLAADKWYSDCSEGCGDVMVCQSFCLDCENHCMVSCSDNTDCEAVGAGSCEDSTYGSNRCSSPPTQCPGDAPSDPPADPTTGGGDVCQDAGETCDVNGDCCDFAEGGALCIDYSGYGTYCGATCSDPSDCASGCCAETDDGSQVCAPSEFCGAGGDTGGDTGGDDGGDDGSTCDPASCSGCMYEYYEGVSYTCCYSCDGSVCEQTCDF